MTILGGMPVRVVVAEDDYFVREGLRRLLETEPEIELVGAYESADALLASIAADRPDVVLTDIRMPPTGLDEGIALAEQLRTSHPAVGVIVLSNFAEPRHAMRLFEQGAAGRAYLLKQRVATRNGLARAIADVATGGSAVDPTVVTTLLAAGTTPDSPLAALTEREREVLALVAEGHSNERIAELLDVSKAAVEKHVNGIFGKLGLGSDPGISRRVKATLLYLHQES
jgi:DNA-binding NarL/FixJ family response regulator